MVICLGERNSLVSIRGSSTFDSRNQAATDSEDRKFSRKPDSKSMHIRDNCEMQFSLKERRNEITVERRSSAMEKPEKSLPLSISMLIYVRLWFLLRELN